MFLPGRTLKMRHQNVTGALRFGPNGITLEDLYLLELRPVSRSSFQPILAVKKEHVTW